MPSRSVVELSEYETSVQVILIVKKEEFMGATLSLLGTQLVSSGRSLECF